MKERRRITAFYSTGTATAPAPTTVKATPSRQSHIVGYNTITGGITQNKYVALGCQFEDVAGGAIPLIKAVTCEPACSGSSSTGSDQIWRWNTSSGEWTKYYLCDNRGDIYWAYDGGRDKVPETVTIPAGETFFFQRGSAASATVSATLTLAGGVKQFDGESSFALTQNQLAFVCNPWPIDLKISSLTGFYQAEGAPIQSSSSIEGADNVWLWNTTTGTWSKYYYCNNREVYYWSIEGKREAVTDADVIPAGQGFFFQRGSSASATTPAIIKITKVN